MNDARTEDLRPRRGPWRAVATLAAALLGACGGGAGSTAKAPTLERPEGLNHES
jgi:hypothetical protein